MLYYLIMDIFSALADPTRRQIVEMLASKGKLPATTISKNFNVSPPAISQHLKVLREAKVVDVEKRAQQRLYTINAASIKDVEKWIQGITKQWEERFLRLDKLFEEENRLKGGEHNDR